MKTLDRYIIRQFLFTALLCFVVLMGLRVIIDLFVNMDEFAKQDKPIAQLFQEIASYYGYQSLVYFVDLGGIIITISATFTLAMMNHTNELTTVLSAGISLRRVVLPIAICSVILGVLITVDQEALIPRVGDKLVRGRDQMSQMSDFSVRLMPGGENSLWWSPAYMPSDGRMQGPLLMLRSDDGESLACIAGTYAQVGRFGGERGWIITQAVLKREGQAPDVWPTMPTTSSISTSVDPTFLLIKAQEAYRRQGQEVDLDRITGMSNVDDMRDPVYRMTLRAKRFIPDPPSGEGPRTGMLLEPSFAYQTRQGQPLGTIFAGAARWAPDKNGAGHWELTGGLLFYPSDLRSEELVLRQSSRWLEYMSSSQLSRLLELDRLPNPSPIVLAKQARLTEPINNLVMLLLALPFILSRERNIKASAGLCLLMVATFFVFVHACRYMGLPPMLAAWLPVMIFGPISVMMFDAVKT